MAEMLTIDEINSRFASEWALLEDPQLSDRMELTGGRVLYHSKDRDEVDRKALELRPRRSAVIFTGELFSRGMEYLLGASRSALGTS
jgi:hypothetical protein